QAQFTLNGKTLQASGEQLLTQDTTLAIKGVGDFVIIPGGDDLGALEQQTTQLKSQSDTLHSSHGIRDHAHAQERHEKAQQLQTEPALVQRELVLRAPDGIQSLHHQYDSLCSQLHAQPAVDDVSQTPAEFPKQSLEEAESAHTRNL